MNPYPDDNGDSTGFLPFKPAEIDRFALRLTRAEFARLMGVSKQTCSEWVQAGKITLGADGRLNPREAVKQLLRNSDPARLRAKVLAPLVRDVGGLGKQIEDLKARLRAAKEDADFHEGAAAELAGIIKNLERRLVTELEELSLLPTRDVLRALRAWLRKTEFDGPEITCSIRDCFPLPDEDAGKTMPQEPVEIDEERSYEATNP